MDSTALITAPAASSAPVVTTGAPRPLLPWRDPHTVPVQDLRAYIATLEQACLAEPQSANLRTCLGIAYAMNYQVNHSMDALELAVSLAPESFWARLKYAELHYRVRALNRAEEETVKAVNLAADGWQLSVARKQLQEIRVLKNGCVRNLEWNKPLAMPTLVLSLMLLAIVVAMSWK